MLHKQQYSALQAQKDVSQMRERSEDEFAHLEHRAQVLSVLALLVQKRASSRTENTVRRRSRTDSWGRKARPKVPSLLALLTLLAGTKVQILTPEELRGLRPPSSRTGGRAHAGRCR